MYRAEYGRLARGLASFGDGAEEAVQEAFVQALVRWKRVGSLEDPAGWVRLVAVRRLLNLRRSEARSAAASARLGRATIDPPDGVRLDVVLAVGALSPQQRVAVGLRYGGGYSLSEVAAAMGLSVGAVKYHLSEARSRLRARLADELSEDRDG